MILSGIWILLKNINFNIYVPNLFYINILNSLFFFVLFEVRLCGPLCLKSLTTGNSKNFTKKSHGF